MDLFDVVAGAIKVGTQIKQTNRELNSTVCPHCGYQLPKAAMFCSRCGNKTVVVQKEIPNNANNRQNGRNQPEQPKQMLPQAYMCAGCRAPLPINKRSEVLICPYCDLQNINPYYEKPVLKQQVQAAPMGCVNCMFDTTNVLCRSLVISVKKTGEKLVLENGHSGTLWLRPGTFVISFNFGERKYYERSIRIYSEHTSVSISCVSGKTRNAINISYTDGILLKEHMLRFGDYKPDDYIQKLYALGFVNIEKRPGPRGSFMSFGRVTNVLIEDICVEDALYSPEEFRETGGEVVYEGSSRSLRIPQEARITVVT